MDTRDTGAATGGEASDTDEPAPRASRPKNSAATKELLLAAATAEFADHGLAGARIDRIAERAGANKRLLYVYFGDKEQLFEAVLQQQIGRLAEETPLVGGDLAAYAAARFDFMLAHPETARLAAWRRFEHDGHFSPAEVESYRAKVAAVAEAQRAGRLDDGLPAVDLFAIVLRITESWLDAPPALAAAAGDGARSGERLREHRAALLEAVGRITAPRSPAADGGSG
jgi:AcrR family transcriptional regulator